MSLAVVATVQVSDCYGVAKCGYFQLHERIDRTSWNKSFLVSIRFSPSLEKVHEARAVFMEREN